VQNLSILSGKKSSRKNLKKLETKIKDQNGFVVLKSMPNDKIKWKKSYLSKLISIEESAKLGKIFDEKKCDKSISNLQIDYAFNEDPKIKSVLKKYKIKDEYFLPHFEENEWDLNPY
jgi:hypothetical protein